MDDGLSMSATAVESSSASTMEAATTTAVETTTTTAEAATGCAATEVTATESAGVAAKTTATEGAGVSIVEAWTRGAGEAAAVAEALRRSAGEATLCSVVGSAEAAVAGEVLARSGEITPVPAVEVVVNRIEVVIHRDIAESIPCALTEVVATVVEVRSTVSGEVVAMVGPAVAAGASVKVASVGPVVDVPAAAVSAAETVVAAVVPEVSAMPVAAVETYAEVAEAVVDTAVVADGGTPVAGVPEVAAGAVAPVAGSPKSTDVGRENPGTVDPLISFPVPGPVARSPDVSGTRHDGLSIDGNRGRSDCNRDKDAGLRGSGREECSTSDDGCTQNRCAEKIASFPEEVHCLPSPRILRFALSRWASRRAG